MPLNINLPASEWYVPFSPGLEEVVQEIAATPLVAIDTETTGLDKMNDRVLYWSIAWRSPASGKMRKACLRSDTLPYFSKFFQETDRTWILANAKFDMAMLANMGCALQGRCADVSVAHALLYEEESHGLKEMTLQILGWTWADFEATFGKVDKNNPLDSIGARLRAAEKNDLKKLVDYASNDAYGTYMLYEELRRRLQKTPTDSFFPQEYPTLWEIFDKTEVPFTRVLYSCERAGLYIDEKYLLEVQTKVDTAMEQALRDLAREAGQPVNPNSGEELKHILFKVLGFKPTKFTKGGKSGVRKPSTDKGALEELENQAVSPGAARFLMALKEYNSVKALKTNFLPALLKKRDKNGRAHTNFGQASTATGRLNSSDPNFQ